jgi:hypothetical protein
MFPRAIGTFMDESLSGPDFPNGPSGPTGSLDHNSSAPSVP